MQYKHKLSVCLCIRNEAKYIPEFIEHYIKQGADHFYIINNKSDDNIEEVIANSPYSRSISLLYDDRELNVLTNPGYEGHKSLLDDNLYERVRLESEWIIIVDADEFMYGRNGHTLKSYIHTIPDDVDCVYVLWNIVRPRKNDGQITSEFSIKSSGKRLNYDTFKNVSYYIQSANLFGKSVIRTKGINEYVKLWLHKAFVHGRVMNNYGETCTNKSDNGEIINYSEDNYRKVDIALNHYAIRNQQDLEKKIKQLDQKPEKYDFIRGLIEMCDLNDEYLVQDDEINLF